MSVARQLFAPVKEDIGKQIADGVRGDFEKGSTWQGNAVVAKSGEWTVVLDKYEVDGHFERVFYVRLCAPYINEENFRFCVYKEGLFRKLEKLFGLQDINIGDEEFDDEFIVQGNYDAKIKNLFADRRLRELIEQQPSIHMGVKKNEDAFRNLFPLGADLFYCTIESELRDMERLSLFYELFAESLHHLCHVSSAYDFDPELPI